MPSKNSVMEEYRIRFKKLPRAARQIIGTGLGTLRSRKRWNLTLRQVRQFQNWPIELYPGEETASKRLRLGPMERRRIQRAVEAAEMEGALRKIPPTHSLVSIAPNGDMVFRQPAPEEAARRSSQGFKFGKFILAERPFEQQVAAARTGKAERLAANRALAAELKRRGAKIQPALLENEFRKNRQALGFAGEKPTATAEKLIAMAPQTAGELIAMPKEEADAIIEGYRTSQAELAGKRAGKAERLERESAWKAVQAQRAAARRRTGQTWSHMTFKQKTQSMARAFAKRTRRP
ncbi:MAG: hypothetical protein V1493_00600 [Candidatus Diapherotrites archaeon]